MNLFSLTGKTAVITGGNSGIGLGMALGLAKAGANIAIIGRNKKKNIKSLEKVKKIGTRAIAIEADVRCSVSAKSAIKEIKKEFRQINILINNAGTTIRKPAEKLTEEEWLLVIDTNLTSTFIWSVNCYPEFKKMGGGKILNNGSMLSLFGSPWGSAYGASKGGVMQLTRSHATAWASENIQVNCFLPGWIDTELTKQARKKIPGLNKKVLDRTPAARWGTPKDMEGIAVFLASPASDFITGTAIPIDGGFSISI
uniref:Dehydrogenases with different specificities (Related to short-chain alcohol dehydrogenases) n=1 Tax=uncultured nuHF1 cluster bacterium HF0770_35I22 TaxID=723586 RepID=E7C7N7_9BACT|nr:dehydrogenases with different specificities (related to short-chain alcohol dehydrogenases) [uncultured nuHF1 cluster bacterium HF0770_35I22]